MSLWQYGIFQWAGNGLASTSWDVDSASLVSVWREYIRLLPGRVDADGTRWAHEICNEDNEERAIVVATMNEMAYVLQAWLPLIVWQQVDAPNYQKGYITITFLSALLIITAFAIRFLWKRELLRYSSYLKVCQSLERANSEIERREIVSPNLRIL
jgi:hypothetical protein